MPTDNALGFALDYFFFHRSFVVLNYFQQYKIDKFNVTYQTSCAQKI